MSGAAEKQTGGIGKGTPGPGRKKGVPNAMTRDVKEMILTALGKAGGVDYLVTQAQANPSAFLTLLGKVLPKELVGKGGAELPGATIVINPVAPRGD